MNIFYIVNIGLAGSSTTKIRFNLRDAFILIGESFAVQADPGDEDFNNQLWVQYADSDATDYSVHAVDGSNAVLTQVCIPSATIALKSHHATLAFEEELRQILVAKALIKIAA